MNFQFRYDHILRGKSLFQVYFCVRISGVCAWGWPWFTHWLSDNPLSESQALSGCSRLILLSTLQSCLITVYHPPHWGRGQKVGNEWCIPPYVVQKDCCSKLSVFPCLETRWDFLGIKHRFKNSQIFTVLFCCEWFNKSSWISAWQALCQLHAVNSGGSLFWQYLLWIHILWTLEKKMKHSRMSLTQISDFRGCRAFHSLNALKIKQLWLEYDSRARQALVFCVFFGWNV